MNDKQKLIIEVAKKYFDTQGIQYTSIEEIVNVCKISKTTFYKYFPTKENLVYEMYLFYNKQFLENMKAIDNSIEINYNEKLKRKVLLMCESLFSLITFVESVNINITQSHNDPLVKLREETRNDLIEQYYKSLLEAYGDTIKPIIWELIFSLDALIHEFVFIMRSQKKRFNQNFIADFIINIIDINIKSLKDMPSMMNKSTFYYNDNDKDYYECDKLLFSETIKKIRKFIDKENTHLDKAKLIQAINKIDEETKSGLYNSFMMDAMIALLEKEKTLKTETSILDDLRIKLSVEKR